MSADLEELQAKAIQAQAQLDSRLVEIEAHEEKKRQERAARLEEHDRQQLAAYSDDALEDEEQQALQVFKAAVAADPVWSAWAQWRALRIKRQSMAGQMSAVAQSLGSPRRFTAPGPGSDKFETVLAETLSKLMYEAADREAEQRAAARRAYADQVKGTK